MKGDFTRDTFNPTKHFTRVLQQQGRTSLDSDFNEESSILLHYLQTLATDLIGRYGGPVNHCGFGIVDPNSLSQNDQTRLKNLGLLPLGQGDLLLGGGRYYVDGILCENEDYTSYLKQPDATGATALDKNNSYLIYLDVWERHVSFSEDDSIREVALGGPDTASRAQVVWQVRTLVANASGLSPAEREILQAQLNDLQQQQKKAQEAGNQDQVKALQQEIDAVQKRLSTGDQTIDCNSAPGVLDNQPTLSDAQLRARAKQNQPATEPCLIRPEARYRGAENQLYRVEIHQGGTAGGNPPATFKWSRENGSVVFPILDVVPDTGSNTTLVTLANLGRDLRLSLAIGNWVELIDDDYTLENGDAPLLQVTYIDRVDMTVTLQGISAVNISTQANEHPLLRRWDQPGDAKQGGAQLVVEATGEDDTDWVALEDGIQIQFQRGGTFRTGDYWLIPARTATGDVDWPRALETSGGQQAWVALPQPPRGILHHYAPLAILSFGADGNADLKSLNDCRCRFNPVPC